MKAFILHQRFFALSIVCIFCGYVRALQAASVDSALLADVEAYARGAVRSLSGAQNLNVEFAEQLVAVTDRANQLSQLAKAKPAKSGELARKAIEELKPSFAKLADVGQQVDKRFAQRAQGVEEFNQYKMRVTGNAIADADKINEAKAIKDLCAAINALPQGAGVVIKTCDPSSISKDEREKLLNLAAKFSNQGEAEKINLDSLKDQLFALGFKVQDPGALNQLVARLNDLHKENDFAAMAAIASGASAQTFVSDSFMTAGLVGDPAVRFANTWQGKVVAGRDPLLPDDGDFVQEPSNEKDLAKASTSSEAPADAPSVGPVPLIPTSQALPPLPTMKGGRGFGFADAPAMTSNDTNNGSREVAADRGPATSDHALSSSDGPAASTNLNPYNDAGVASPVGSGGVYRTDAPILGTPYEHTTGISDILSRGLMANAASGGPASESRQTAEVLLPEDYSGTRVIRTGSPFQGGGLAEVLGGANETDDCKRCRPSDGTTLAPKSEDDCNAIFRSTFMTKNSDGNEVLDVERFFGCMNKCVAKIAYEDDLIDPTDRDSQTKTAQVLTAKMNLYKPDPKPDSDEIKKLVKNLLATERLYSRGSCGALGLKEDYFLKNPNFKKHTGCMTLIDSSFSVQKQFADRSLATKAKGVTDRGLFESLFLTYQSGAIGNLQGTYPSLFGSPIGSAAIFMDLQSSAKQFKSESGKGALPNLLHNLTGCYAHDQVGGYLIGMDTDSDKGLDKIFGCHDKFKIREALVRVSKHASLDPPCKDKPITEAWLRMQKADPEKRKQVVDIMNSVVSSHEFVSNITNFVTNPVLNYKNPKLAKEAQATRKYSKQVSEGGSDIAAIIACNGRATCPQKSFNLFGQGHNLKSKKTNDRKVAGEPTIVAHIREPAAIQKSSAECLDEQLKVVRTRGASIGGDPKENFSKEKFSAAFAEAVQTELEVGCSPELKEFKGLLVERERNLRAEACACSHIDAINLMNRKNEPCSNPKKSLKDCSETLGDYSYLIGSIFNLKLNPSPLTEPAPVNESKIGHPGY